MDIAWMHWTTPTASFFVFLAAALTLLGIWDMRSPNVKWRGFLPLAFGRGDRFFLSMVIFFGVILLWGIFLAEISLGYALPVAAAIILVVVRYG